MNRRRNVLLAMLMLMGVSRAWAGDGAPVATLEVSADRVQPAGVPIILTLVVRNSGTVPIGYWCAGPGEFPNAVNYRVIGAGRAAINLYNGQWSNGSGRRRVVEPGKVVRFPAALPPLKPGKYSLLIDGDAEGHKEEGELTATAWPKLSSVQPIKIEIREDRSLVTARVKWVVDRIRAGDSFVQYLQFRWPSNDVRTELAKDLLGDNIVVADRAAQSLWGGDQPPEEDAPLVTDAILHHLKPPSSGCDAGLISRLCFVQDRVLSPKLTDAVKRLADARTDKLVHEIASDALALSNLKEFDNRTQHGTQLPADPAMLQPLLQLAASADPDMRRKAIRGLAGYPGSPDAADAIRKALYDTDEKVYQEAERSLQIVNAGPATTQP